MRRLCASRVVSSLASLFRGTATRQPSATSSQPPLPATNAAFLAQELALLRTKVDEIAMSAGESRKSEREENSVPHEMLHAVVKIFSSVSVPNFLIPWQRKLQASHIGSGFVADAKRRLVLTNAHVIACATFVELRKHGEALKFTGYVVYIGADCDLALVHVPEAQFWENSHNVPFEGSVVGASGLEAVSDVPPFGGLPPLQHNVKVVGYPMGGDQISITSGVVSRIDVSPYGGAENFLMTIQLDAAINPGNSGGPALCEKKVVGVAFQSLITADNIGYIIPNPVVATFARTFLKDAVNRVLNVAWAPREYHPGFCSLGVILQEMTNETLRRSVGMRAEQTGALVLTVFPTTNATGILKTGDVLLEVFDKKIANDLTIEFRPRERMRFSHLVQMRIRGETVRLLVLREGKELELTVPLKPDAKDRIIPNHLFDDKHRETPRYALFGGLVFSNATLPLLMEWGTAEWYNNSPRWLSSLVHGGFATSERDEVVIAVQVLPHLVNKGYSPESLNHRMLTHVQGTAVRNFDHAVELLNRLPNNDSLATLILSNGIAPIRVVLPVKSARQADDELMKVYHIPPQRENGKETTL